MVEKIEKNLIFSSTSQIIYSSRGVKRLTNYLAIILRASISPTVKSSEHAAAKDRLEACTEMKNMILTFQSQFFIEFSDSSVRWAVLICEWCGDLCGCRNLLADFHFSFRFFYFLFQIMKKLHVTIAFSSCFQSYSLTECCSFLFLILVSWFTKLFCFECRYLAFSLHTYKPSISYKFKRTLQRRMSLS